MKKLPPGVTFEYKNENGYTYGAPKGTDDWTLIGRMVTDEDYQIESVFKKLKTYIFSDSKKYKTRAAEIMTWCEILQLSETNCSLQEAMERVKSIYYMTAKNDT